MLVLSRSTGVKIYECKKTQILITRVNFPVHFLYPIVRKFFTAHKPFLCVRKITHGSLEQLSPTLRFTA